MNKTLRATAAAAVLALDSLFFLLSMVPYLHQWLIEFPARRGIDPSAAGALYLSLAGAAFYCYGLVTALLQRHFRRPEHLRQYRMRRFMIFVAGYFYLLDGLARITRISGFGPPELAAQDFNPLLDLLFMLTSTAGFILCFRYYKYLGARRAKERETENG